MQIPVQRAARLGQVAALAAAAVLLGGCGPKVTMSVQVQDAQGNLKNQFTVTNSDSGPTTVEVAYGDTIIVTPSATYSDGLQKLWLEGAKSCQNQASNILEPPGGNAISPGTAPTQASFTNNFGAFNCAYPAEMDLDAAATSNPATGVFGGGPATNRTQKAVLVIPKGHGK